jgi:mannose-6-phosphate isomerase
MGTKRPLSPEELRAVSLSGEIEGLMDWKPVRAGDYFYIPAGTVHAIGAGITLVEIQQYADVTYRLYDYGRLDKGVARQLHLDDGVAVSRAAPYTDPRSGRADGSQRLVSGPHFWLNHVTDTAALASIREAGPYWLVPLSGETIVDETPLQPGDCLLSETLEAVALQPQSGLLVAGVVTN